jgi:23S rRNA pseudouridine2605 synthase
MTESADASSGERIAKMLARAGVCSRRDAEKLIAEGRVSVNGARLDTPAFKVFAGDDVRVDGKRVAQPQPARLWRYHKPSGLLTTNHDPKGRPTIYEKLPADLPRVISIGRLDMTTEGLLLLTNDGELARQMELPANAWTRTYRARAFGRVAQTELDALADGVEVAGVRYGAIVATLERQQGGNAWISLVLTEGKNREVRRVLEALGLKVNRLIRTSYGPFELGLLNAGQVEEVQPRRVRDLFGPSRARRRGASGG